MTAQRVRAALCGILLLGAAGCGGGEPEAPPASTKSEPAPPAADGASASTQAAARAQRGGADETSSKRLIAQLFEDARYDPTHPLVRVAIKPKPSDTLADTAERYAADQAAAEDRVMRQLEQVRAKDDASLSMLERAYLAAASLLSKDGRAVRAAELLDEWAERVDGRLDPASEEARLLLGRRALAWMRVGEVENCVARHVPDCCTLPLRGGALHTEKRGSTRARALWSELLEFEPDNLTAQWLLNVTAMTLGEWPDGVEERWRLTPRSFAEEASFPAFQDVAGDLGLDVLSCSGGVVVEDLDGDGALDVFFTDWQVGESAHLFLGGSEGFRDTTAAAGISDQTGGLNVTHADYDGDGDADLFVARGAWRGPQRNSLLRNDGAGRFTDVTDEVGLARPMHPVHAAPWADIDVDGDLDLFVGVENTGGRQVQLPSQLFRNDDGKFRDVASDVGVEIAALVKGAAFGDVDGDGYPELYASVFGGDNVLWHNRGGAFVDVTGKAGVAAPRKSFPTWFMDYDQDGALDLFVACYEYRMTELVRGMLGLPHEGDTLRLFRNEGDLRFRDVTVEVGLDRTLAVMGAGFGDISNDGYPDVYLGTGSPSYAALVPNALFLNDEGREFVDVTTAARVGHLQKGHGVAFADLEGDGDLDLVIEMGGSKRGDAFPNAVYENPGWPGRHFLSVELEGVASNRAGIGALITLELEDADGAPSRRFVSVGTGGSFGSSPFRQHVGLGEATRIVSLSVEWPGRETQRFEDVPVDGSVRIRQGAKTLQVANGSAGR